MSSRNPLDYTAAQQTKALLSGLSAGVALLAGGADNGISIGEGLGAFAALLATYVAVFYVENRDPRGVDDDGSSTIPGPGPVRG